MTLSSDGLRAAIGSGDGEPYAGVGSVSVYTRSGSSWSLEATLRPGAGSDFGAAVSLSADGSRALIGAPANAIGSAHVFRRSGSSWTEEAPLVPAGAAPDDGVALGVALSPRGDRALVSSPMHGPSDDGRASVFVRSGDRWVEEAALSDASAATFLGSAVAFASDGERAFLGAGGSVSSFVRTTEGWAHEATHVGPTETYGGTLAVTALGDALIVGADPEAHLFDVRGSTWTWRGLLRHGGGAPGGRLGYSVALSGDASRAIVGAPYDPAETSVAEVGRVRVFERAGDDWDLVDLPLVPPSARGGEQFGYSVALSGDGRRFVVSAPYDDSAAPDAGTVYVFKQGTGGYHRDPLSPSGRAAYDSFGFAVAISSDGDRVLVGAPNADVGALGSAGAAHVFAFSSAGWREEARLISPDARGSDWLGAAVALSQDGSRALVAAFGDDTPAGSNAGSVLVFARIGTSWAHEATLLAPDAGDGDGFGTVVALSADGGRALIGAHLADNARGVDAGAAYVFARSGSAWYPEVTLLATGGAAGDAFGAAVALSADGARAVVAAHLDDAAGGADAGSVRAFVRDGTGWTEQALLSPAGSAAGDAFGYAVALSADGARALIGAPLDDTPAGADVGSARVFTLATGLGLAAACLADADCDSRHCVDGVCCENACGAGASDCSACSVATGGTHDGACTPLVPARAASITCRPAVSVCDAPEVCHPSTIDCPSDLVADARLTCRAAAGPCDVAETCDGLSPTCPRDGFAGRGTTCALASCASGVARASATCTGSSAACPGPVTTPCARYACGATACLARCATDSDCSDGFGCEDGRCAELRPDAGLADAGVADAGAHGGPPRGCGCRATNGRARGPLALLGLLAIALAARRARVGMRRSSSASPGLPQGPRLTS